MSALTCDAVVIGAGHNGLVAANLLADAGWDVIVVEAAGHPAAPFDRAAGWRRGSPWTSSRPSTR